MALAQREYATCLINLKGIVAGPQPVAQSRRVD